MQLKKIKVGRWYQTKAGVGKCVRVGGTFPPTVRIDIVEPFPRGVVNVVPKDVLTDLGEAAEPGKVNP